LEKFARGIIFQPTLYNITVARLSWSHSAFVSTLNSSIVSYRIVATWQ